MGMSKLKLFVLRFDRCLAPLTVDHSHDEEIRILGAEQFFRT